MIKKIQYIILSFFLTRVLFIGTGFNIIINLSKNSFLISSILGTIIGLIILYILYKKKTINNYLLIIITITVLITISITNISLTTTYLLSKTPIIIILLSFILINIYGSKKELITTGRISTIIILPTILLTIFSLWGLTSLVELNNLLPLFNSNIKDFLISTISFTSFSTLPNLLLLNYNNKLKFKDISIGYITGSLFIIILMFYIISIYGYELSSITRFPEYLILKKVFVINNINNIENILILEWISCILITSLICTNILKSNLNKRNFYLIIIIISIIIIFSIHKSFNYLTIIQNYSNYLYSILIIITIIIPSFKKKS